MNTRRAIPQAALDRLANDLRALDHTHDGNVSDALLSLAEDIEAPPEDGTPFRGGHLARDVAMLLDDLRRMLL